MKRLKKGRTTRTKKKQITWKDLKITRNRKEVKNEASHAPFHALGWMKSPGFTAQRMPMQLLNRGCNCISTSPLWRSKHFTSKRHGGGVPFSAWRVTWDCYRHAKLPDVTYPPCREQKSATWTKTGAPIRCPRLLLQEPVLKWLAESRHRQLIETHHFINIYIYILL